MTEAELADVLARIRLMSDAARAELLREVEHAIALRSGYQATLVDPRASEDDRRFARERLARTGA